MSREYTIMYLSKDQVERIILASLSVRPMTEDELTDVVEWADDAYRRFGILENVFAGTLGLEPLPLPDRGVITRLLDHPDTGDVLAPAVSTEIS